MSGETGLWLELASRLHKCLQEVQEGTTSTEFVMWRLKMEQEWTSHRVEHYYWAQIAAEIRRVLAKKPQSIKTGDFLIKFQLPKPKVEKPLTPEEIEARKELASARALSKWSGLLNFFGKKK